MSHSSNLVEAGEGVVEPLIYSQVVPSTGSNLDLQLESEGQ